MPAYMIARTTINDRDKYVQEFMPLMRKAFEAHGAKLLAVSDAVITIKGPDQIAHAAIVEFLNHAAAMACATSPDFLAAMNIAETIMTDHAVRLVDGLAVAQEAVAAEREPAE